MRYFPIELDVQGREALVVGAGPETVAKIDRLLAAGAAVTVVARGDVDPGVLERAAQGRITLERRAFTEADREGKALTFVASSEEHTGRKLAARAAHAGELVCTIDRPEACTFVSPAVVDVSGLTMSFSSGGASPGTVKRIREDLTALFADERFARFVQALRELRASIPREERFARMSAAVRGFAVEARLRFPDWFQPSADPERGADHDAAPADPSPPSPSPSGRGGPRG